MNSRKLGEWTRISDASHNLRQGYGNNRNNMNWNDGEKIIYTGTYINKLVAMTITEATVSTRKIVTRNNENKSAQWQMVHKYSASDHKKHLGETYECVVKNGDEEKN